MKATRVLVLILVLTLVPIPFMPLAAADTLSETFEDEPVNEIPDENWYDVYTTGVGDFRVTGSAPTLGAKSYLQAPVVGLDGAHTMFDLDGSTDSDSIFIGPCSTTVGVSGADSMFTSDASVSFAFRVSNLPSVNDFYTLALGPDDAAATLASGSVLALEANGFKLRVDSSGIVNASIVYQNIGADTTTTSAVGVTVSAGTWYNVTVDSLRCTTVDVAYTGTPQATTSWRIYFADQDVLVTQTITGNNNHFDGDQVNALHFVSPGDGDTSFQIRVDNINFDEVIAPAADPIAASATATVTGLVGFDVDPAGNLPVVRYNGGEDVATHDSLSLAQAATVDTNCGTRSHGVMSQTDGTDSFAFYIQCDPGDNDPIGMRIRTATLNTPTSTQLNGCGTSCADFTLTDFSSSGGDGLSELGEIDAYPISYREQDLGGAFDPVDSFYLAWGWSSLDNTGIVGVNAFSNHQSITGATDGRRSYDLGYSSGNANQVCTGVDGEQTYLAAVRSGALSRVYPIGFTFEDGEAATTTDLVPGSGGTPTTFGSVQGGGEGVACGDGLVAILNSGGIWVMNRDGGLYRSYEGVDVDPRGVSLSLETSTSQYLSYVDGAEWVVRDLADNSTLCSGPMPSGDLIGFSLTGGAQNLYVATDAASNNLARFELGGVCTPIVDEETGEDVVPTATPTGGLFGGAGAAIAPGLGTSTFGGNLFLGIIVVAGMAAGTFALSKGKIAGLILGVGIGVVLAWGLGFFTGGTVFVLVLLCGGGLYLFGRG